MADPVSWLLVEPGWAVFASDETPLGSVATVLGSKQQDIFDGLAVSAAGHPLPKYVEADFVGRIVEGLIHLRLTPEEFAALDGHDAPGAANVERD